MPFLAPSRARLPPLSYLLIEQTEPQTKLRGPWASACARCSATSRALCIWRSALRVSGGCKDRVRLAPQHARRHQGMNFRDIQCLKFGPSTHL